ncbi:MAG: tetratricopeptide repeat protein [Planctomycetes bacterium]|nr:tetratricopeptide repeat protein [Planctomycetota bacterium]
MRFLGYFLLVFAALALLRAVPVVGELFRVPLFGFFLAAALVSALVARVGDELTRGRKLTNELTRLGAVDTPHNQGKLGRLLELSGKPARAVAPLEAACDGEPEVAEWPYRLGRAQLALGRLEPALAALERARELDEEHAYGDVLLSLAEARRRHGDARRALDVLGRFEVLHGPSPESAFRRGQAHAALRDAQAAKAAFAEVSTLAANAAKYQRADARRWAAKAFFARLLA